MYIHRSEENDKRILKDAKLLDIRKIKVLHHKIIDICGVICSGAYGDPNSWARFIYGKRPDGKTVRCKVTFFERDLTEGITFPCVYVWSLCKNTNKNESLVCASVFTVSDWHKSGSLNKEKQKEFLNIILKKRRIAAYQDMISDKIE